MERLVPVAHTVHQISRSPSGRCTVTCVGVRRVRGLAEGKGHGVGVHGVRVWLVLRVECLDLALDLRFPRLEVGEIAELAEGGYDISD